ncbi:Fe/S biogenesis protein NfuA [Buchnera aphidicola (Nipponaphis monzeni)]|uniref:Fe/S biogenesis protein NfuA n=1 Tax=Buchnera aphidicola (Nipponaphis monzeni) TaxID=2495405 RepID=A0A455TAS0_9GAMM|nr:NifU family protein [Buchnera aphidicola]BBI01415.1 Fe/S biogenesis protein NfuA [Buchnera aphidicola (Nipponaphis monzeni)]
MLIISNKAENYLSNLLKKEKKGTNIRIFVLNPGTYYADCGLTYCSDKELTNDDIQLQFTNFNIFINCKIAKYLKDSSIDLVYNNTQYELLLKAPYVKLKPPTKQSSLNDRVEYFIQSKINVELSKHGGKVVLIEITKEGCARLKFHGGCNGCSMSSQTFKEGIEKQLLLNFSELSEVKDITKHEYGRHSYY